MAFSEQTAHYGLPHWLGDDKPTFLSDLNGAFEDIDAGIYEAKQAGEQGQADAATVDGKVTTLTGRVETLESDDTSLTGRVGTLETTVSGQGGSINTINSLIGNGEPTTTDKTLIGAINELDAGKADETDLTALATTVSGKVDKGNILKYLGYKVIYLEANGSETYGDLIQRVLTEFNTYITAKGDSYRYKFSSAYASALDVYPVCHLIRDLYSHDSIADVRFTGSSLNANGDVVVGQIFFGSTPRIGRNVAGTYTDYVNDTASGQIRIYFEEFELV